MTRSSTINRRQLAGAALGTSASFALAACGPDRSGTGQAGDAGQPPTGKPITLIDTFPPTMLDPAGASGGALTKVGMAELLIRLNRKLEMEPWLATSWRNLDPLRWEIKLREGVTFWDGTPMDATAVKASLERAIAKSGEARVKLKAESIEATDARTLVIKTQAPNASLHHALATNLFGIHSAKAAAAMGDDAFAVQPVMTGPFKPVNYKKDEVLNLVRYDGYWAGKPFLPAMQVKYVLDANARILAVQSGDADLAFAVPIQALGTLKNARGVRIVETMSDNQYFIFLDKRSAPTDDARVRRAISLGIDRKELVEKVLAGAVELAPDVYAPIYPWALKNGYPTDQAKAARSLDEAGWRAGSDGVRRKDGKPLAFTILHYPQNADLLPLAIAIQAQLKRLGITTDLREVPVINSATKVADWGGAMFRNNTGSGDPLYLMDTFFRPEGSQWFGYAHPDMPRLIEQIQTTIDEKKRLELVRQFQELMVEEAPLVPLVVIKSQVLVGDRLKNVQAHPANFMLVDHTFGK